MFQINRKAIFCLTAVVILGGLSVSYVQAQGDVCQQVQQEQAQYLEAQAVLEEELHALAAMGSEDLDIVYSQLMKYVGKSLGDVSAEVQKVQLVSSLLNEKAELIFELADQNDDKAYEWIDRYSSCGWGDRTLALEEWQAINYENLSTIASFIGGYASLIVAWPAQWEKLSNEARAIDEESFAQVEEVRKGLEESVELMSDTFEYTKEAFEAARP